MITARTQIKSILKEEGFKADKIADDFVPRLDQKVREIVIKAAQRAEENGRKTVMARDV